MRGVYDLMTDNTFSVERASLIAHLVKNTPANAGDPGSIPGPGRSAGEGIGYPLQYSWASLELYW